MTKIFISKVDKLVTSLDALKIGETIKKKEYIQANWPVYDFFTTRSFDVTYVKAKEKLPNKSFDGRYNKEIKRVY